MPPPALIGLSDRSALASTVGLLLEAAPAGPAAGFRIFGLSQSPQKTAYYDGLFFMGGLSFRGRTPPRTITPASLLRSLLTSLPHPPPGVHELWVALFLRQRPYSSYISGESMRRQM